jgi:hypothetical protein
MVEATEGPPHPYTKVASTARRIFDHQCKKTFATQTSSVPPRRSFRAITPRSNLGVLLLFGSATRGR